MPHIVAISGKSGCGNSTVSRLLAERLGYAPINYTLRNMAAELGKSLDEILALAREDDGWDRRLDERQKELARAADCVVGSRLAMWLLPEADLRVYLWGGIDVRAERIHLREKGDHDTRLAETRLRDERDHERYLRIYGIDNDDATSADILINTERYREREIVEICAEALRQKIARSPARAGDREGGQHARA